MLRWATVWSLLGVLVGIPLAFGDTGHLLPILVPISLGTVAGLGGALASQFFRLLCCYLGRVLKPGPLLRLLLAGLAGSLAAICLYYLGLGVRFWFILAGGVVAGVLSVLAAGAGGEG